MTDTNKADEQILKVDTRGRVTSTAKRRAALLEEFDRSGLSGKKFAELAGVKYPTFATWLQQRRRQGQPAAQPAATVRWLEAVVDQASRSGDNQSLVVTLPGGARLELNEPTQLPLVVALLRALERPC